MADEGSKPARRGPPVNRRVFLASGVGVVSGGLTASVAVWADPRESAPWLIGSVERVESDRVFHLRPVGADAGAVRVVLADRATVLRDGPAALTDFVPGDEVGAGGKWTEDGAYRARSVESTYRLVDAEVTARRGQVLSTDQGEVVVTPETESRAGLAPRGEELEATPPGAISPGDHIVTLGRKDPESDRVRAVVLGTRA